jgi:hypothetical protein
MAIADTAQGPANAAGAGAAGAPAGAAVGAGASAMLGSVKAKLGFGGDAKPEGQLEANVVGFPTAGAALPIASPARATPVPPAPATAQAGAPKKPEPSGPPGPARDWSKMLGRVKADVDRVCAFLEALAKHPRGLQKYHEEAVRTVHDSWLDREGEQSLRRWVRSECSRIWPHKFAAIEAEKERARADIDALEELFGGGSPDGGPAPRAAGAKAAGA